MNKYIIPVMLACVLYAPVASAATDEERAAEITAIEAEAEILTPGTGSSLSPVKSFEDYLLALAVESDSSKTELGESLYAEVFSYMDNYESVVSQTASDDPLVIYIGYGTETTQALGAGERAGVVDSWIEAQLAESDDNYVPFTTTHWEDILKIANGRWPSEAVTSDEREAAVEDTFETIYGRTPDRTNANDDAAIMIMSYGLRPEPRDTSKEAVAIETFEHYFGYAPTTATHWDAVRAIAYSGATR